MNNEGATPLFMHPVLGRGIRSGPWSDQGVSTYSKILSALDRDVFEEARVLLRYALVEADVCFRLYGQWRADLLVYLEGCGVDLGELESTLARILSFLALPDGSPFDRLAMWDALESKVEFVADSIGSMSIAASVDAVDDVFETWRRIHDRDVDTLAGLMQEVVARFGEDAIGQMYDSILVPWFQERYSQFDVDLHPWSQALDLNVRVAFEAMRGHLCGPDRRGDVEFEEREDRVVLRFDPCGSGGRTVRGDTVEGTPARMEPPYNWPVTQEPAAWNHFEAGVCVYCAHCIVLTEQMPIDAFGYPTRVVDPPRYGVGAGPSKCSWTMFKDPAEVPEEYYLRVGRTKPALIGSIARGGQPHPTTRFGILGDGLAD